MRFALLPLFLVGACAYDLDALVKGEVDGAAMADGVEVTLDGALASVRVPFSAPVPDVPEADFEDEMQQAASLRVVSVRSGAAIDVMLGEVVPRDPSAAGEVAWILAGDHREATFAFWNGGGLTLEPGQRYAAHFSIASNDHVVRVPAMAFDVAVSD